MYNSVRPLWNQYTDNKWPLLISDVVVADKDGAAIERGERDVIAHNFFQRKGKSATAALVFKPKLYIVNAIVNERVYEKWEEYVEEEEAQLKQKSKKQLAHHVAQRSEVHPMPVVSKVLTSQYLPQALHCFAHVIASCSLRL